MNHRKLGNSDLKISEVSFGCMSLDFKQTDAVDLIYNALDKGITFFDTADLYDKGENEKFVGKVLKDKRKDIVIATKVGNEWRNDGSGWDWNPSKAYIMKAVDRSLKRLQTDYIDLYQLHGGTLEDPIDETIEAFELLKEQGKIRTYGISSIRPNVIREYARKSNVSSVMMQYSMLDRRPEESCLPLLKQNNIGVLARGTLAKGLLSSKPARDYLDHSKNEVALIDKDIQEIADQSGDSAAHAAVSFVLSHSVITSAVVGFRTKEQLDDVFLKDNSFVLSKDHIEQLRENVKMFKYQNHR